MSRPKVFDAWEKTWDGTLVKHEFNTMSDRDNWLEETRGLSLASYGGRGFLSRFQERKHSHAPVITHKK